MTRHRIAASYVKRLYYAKKMTLYQEAKVLYTMPRILR
jgi:hypothetical protein